MNTISLGPNHILFRAGRDMRDISAPLRDHFKINEFTYERIYNDNYKIKLTNQPEWMALFYENQFYIDGEGILDFLPEGVHHTSSMCSLDKKNEDIFKCCSEVFHIGEGILVIEEKKIYKELYWFTGSSHESGLINYYNHMDLLKIFINYFKDKASGLIKQAESEKIRRPLNRGKLQKFQNIRVDESAFIKCIRSKDYVFHHDNRDLVLTQKELQCAVGLIKGLSSSAIAKNLSRSKRTIESHIERIKDKIQVGSKAELVEVLLALNIDIYLDKPF